jgi:hypothetical protein
LSSARYGNPDAASNRLEELVEVLALGTGIGIVGLIIIVLIVILILRIL